MKITIDRFEGKYAVCERENQEMVNIEKSRIPKGAHEGDVLVEENGIFQVDQQATSRRKERLRKLMDELWN